jgi:leader peptidase (prepilin peptidase) / N-methyltransferase
MGRRFLRKAASPHQGIRVTILLYSTIFLLGTLLGSQLNRGIYRLAWNPRPIGPWSSPHPAAPPRRGWDRVPVVGWFGLRRESTLHGAGYWVRPALLELAVGAGLAWLYWWQVDQAALYPVHVPKPELTTLVAQYLIHTGLISLMIVATFIDLDEKTIPDAITLPGTLLLLALAAMFPKTALPDIFTVAVGGQYTGPLLVSSPNPWPPWLNDSPGLAIGIGCLVGWALAIWPKTATLRCGLIKAMRYLTVSMFRYPYWKVMVTVTAVCSLLIAAVWMRGADSWESLLSALVGMAFGGGLIWAVRIIGSGALGKEAMGFGDVTLMAMIGACVGWQPSLMVFFMAPFVAVIFCLLQWILTRRRDIAFGPYLCGAALVLLLFWDPIWKQARPIFGLGWLIPQVLFFCLILMGGLLSLWRITEQLLFRHGTPPGRDQIDA